MPADTQPSPPPPAGQTDFWMLDPQVTFLNHGSFGSCPRPVLEFQEQIRRRIELEPVQFFVYELESLLDQARAALARFLEAPADDLVFVTNATAGVNTVLRSLPLRPGDELLVTDHEYNACRNALNFTAEKTGAAVVEALVPFPCASSDQICDSILSRVTGRTCLALLDHITSQTGLVMPIERLAGELADRGVDVLVDGAHAPGMVPLSLRRLGVAYYTGNCHKWLCAPKGAGFLYVRPDKQSFVRPLAISHGANSTRRDRAGFQIEFGWTGTWDPSAFLAVPEAIRCMGALLPGGWPEVMRRNRELALAGRKLLCEALGIALPCPEECIGSLASVPIPDAASSEPPASPLYADPLQEKLFRKYSLEVPVIPWPALPKRLLRISAQLYNDLSHYQRLAEALRTELR